MAHLVLYRKYRPQTFAEVVGQEHIVKTLMNEIASGDISHAYLFAGPRGTGKTTLARLLAKSINCQNRKPNEAEPCNQCSSCQEIAQGRAVDLIEIDAGTNTGIEDIRNLKEGIGFSPVKSKYKVFIIDECHQLSKFAANALLKTLEEPPAHAIFVLATTEPHRMIPTILSRCQRFDFKRVEKEKIEKNLEMILKKEGVEFEKGAVSVIASLANGSVRDAQTLLDQAISFCQKEEILSQKIVQELLGLSEVSTIIDFLNFLLQKNPKGAIEILHYVSSNGADIGEFVKSALGYLREAFLLKISPDFEGETLSQLEKSHREKFMSLIENTSFEFLKKTIESLSRAQLELRYSTIQELPVELAIAEICGIK